MMTGRVEWFLAVEWRLRSGALPLGFRQDFWQAWIMRDLPPVFGPVIS